MCVGHNQGWEEAASDFAGKEVKLKVGLPDVAAHVIQPTLTPHFSV
jgi:hypothetical protein